VNNREFSATEHLENTEIRHRSNEPCQIGRVEADGDGEKRQGLPDVCKPFRATCTQGKAGLKGSPFLLPARYSTRIRSK
jgi:hypothetical protein